MSINQSRKVIFIVLLGILIISNTATPLRADYVVIDWGDVVKLKNLLNYRYPGEPPTFYSQTHVELYLGDSVPPDINQTFDRVMPMFAAFREKVIGMKEGEKRSFTLSYKDADITNQSEILYGADLLYTVEFLEMLYDAEYDPIPEFSLAHPLVLLSLAGASVLIYIIIQKRYFQKAFNFIGQRVQPSCSMCGQPTSLKCASSGCHKILCSSCFSKNNGCPYCKGTKLAGLK